MNYRIEKDILGDVLVENNKYWGAQTERSRKNFQIGKEASMPLEIIEAFAYIKKAAVYTNYDLGLISKKKKELISIVCDEILDGKLNDHFPLVIWQTGSGTHSNMNINEVIANRAHVINGGVLGKKQYTLIHPNDDVNKSQSSNDTYPTAMNIAAYKKLIDISIPGIEELNTELKNKVILFKNIIKIGRTHLMDATPLTLGQEFSSYTTQLDNVLKNIKNSLFHIAELALGGTAVGTGLNAPKGYDIKVADYIAKFTNLPFKTGKNKFEALAAHDALVSSHATLKQCAVVLMKIANDIRMLASGPRCGIGEFILPMNEPGSSIMPGKINPTQCEAVNMVCTQVIGNDVTISMAGSLGNFELNTFKPVIIYNFLQSAELIGQVSSSFSKNCIHGIKPNLQRIKYFLDNSLMLITALNPYIGYEKAANIAKYAYNNNINLKEAAVILGYVTAEEFEQWVVPNKMINTLE